MNLRSWTPFQFPVDLRTSPVHIRPVSLSLTFFLKKVPIFLLQFVTFTLNNIVHYCCSYYSVLQNDQVVCSLEQSMSIVTAAAILFTNYIKWNEIFPFLFPFLLFVKTAVKIYFNQVPFFYLVSIELRGLSPLNIFLVNLLFSSLKLLLPELLSYTIIIRRKKLSLKQSSSFFEIIIIVFAK